MANLVNALQIVFLILSFNYTVNLTYLCKNSGPMSNKKKLPVMPVFFIIMKMMILINLSAYGLGSINIQLHLADTLPETPNDTIRQIPPDTVPAPPVIPIDTVDTVISPIELPATDTIPEQDTLPEPEVQIPETEADTITEFPETPTPAPETEPTITERPQPVAPPSRITVFDITKAYTVPWDSVLVKPEGLDISHVFPASEKYGPHDLKPSTGLAAHNRTEQSRPADIFALILLLCILLIGLSKFLFPLRFKEIIMAGWMTRFYTQLEREGGTLNTWVSFFLFLNYIIVLSMIIYKSLDFAQGTKVFTNIPVVILLVYIFSAIILFFGVKYLVIRTLAWVFKTVGPTESYSLNILLINYSTGLILLPVLIIYIYNPIPVILYTMWVLFFVINVFKLLRGTIIGLKATGFSAYYLILYLCAIEIAPLIFIIKFSQNYINTWV